MRTSIWEKLVEVSWYCYFTLSGYFNWKEKFSKNLILLTCTELCGNSTVSNKISLKQIRPHILFIIWLKEEIIRSKIKNLSGFTDICNQNLNLVLHQSTITRNFSHYLSCYNKDGSGWFGRMLFYFTIYLWKSLSRLLMTINDKTIKMTTSVLVFFL